MTERRLGLVTIAIGLVLVVLVQRAAPIAGPPLYDGVVVTDPYRWLVPPAGQRGDPQGASASIRLENGLSPVVVAATPEQPPQAQIFAAPEALALPPGTTSIEVSITAVPPQALPGYGHIAGNVYRIRVANQDGAPVAGLPGGQVSVVMRGPPEATEATIELFRDGAWQPVPTQATGIHAMYLAVVTEFGDFALVQPGPGGSYPTATQEAGTTTAPGGSVATSVPTSTAAGSAPGTGQPTEPPIPGGQAGGGGAPVALIAVGIFALAALGAWVGLAARDRRRRRRAAGWGARRRGR